EDRPAIDWLFRSIGAGHADPEGTILNWFAEYVAGGKREEAREVLERGARQLPSSETIARELGLLRFKSKDCPGAYEAVSRFESSSQDRTTLNTVALFKTCLGRRDEAVALFQKSLALQPNQPGVVQSLNLLQREAPRGQ